MKLNKITLVVLTLQALFLYLQVCGHGNANMKYCSKGNIKVTSCKATRGPGGTCERSTALYSLLESLSRSVFKTGTEWRLKFFVLLVEVTRDVT